MHILSAAAGKRVDEATMKAQKLKGRQLMERAAINLTSAMIDLELVDVEMSEQVIVLCGSGNNGGDGLAIARLLSEEGLSVVVWHALVGKPSRDNAHMRDQLKDLAVDYHEITEKTSLDTLDFSWCGLMIDALFGSGLSRPITGFWAELVELCNAGAGFPDRPIIAIDLPSGLPADQAATGAVIHANYTLCVGLPKLPVLFSENDAFVGNWTTVDIDLEDSAVEKEKPLAHFTLAQDMRPNLRERGRFDHKGTFGHAAIVAGSHGKMGAAMLCARAALRAGAGLVTAYVPECGYQLMQLALPEAMCAVDEHGYVISRVGEVAHFQAIGIGPGLGQNPLTVNAIDDLLDRLTAPVVVDADALNILSKKPEWLERLPKQSILTPHPKEFDRLFGNHDSDFRRWKTLQERATSLELIIVLKGGYTCIAVPGQPPHFNNSGNPGMGTGGSGDVLTGVITGLLAQGYDPATAARLGVYLHGLAGDLAAEEEQQEALIAGDLIKYLGKAFHYLRESW